MDRSQPDPDGGPDWAVPLAGLLEPSQLPVSVTRSDGRVVTYDWR